MTPLQILRDLARAQGNPALPLMVPDAVRTLTRELFANHNGAWQILRWLESEDAIELRPDAGHALTPEDLALCPRGAGGVPLVTLVVREVPCSRCGKSVAWDGVDTCSSCLEAYP